MQYWMSFCLQPVFIVLKLNKTDSYTVLHKQTNWSYYERENPN